MSALYRAEVIDVRSSEVSIRLTIVNPDARRFWNTKSFGLWLILEPIFLGCVTPGAITKIVPQDVIDAWDPARLRSLASRVVTNCACTIIASAVPEHLAAIDAMSPDEIRAYFEDGARLPRANMRIRLKTQDLGDHLLVGLAWDSAACDMG
jgi:hypothetical protein